MARVVKTDQPVGHIFTDEFSKRAISTSMAGKMTQTRNRKKSAQAVRRKKNGPMPPQPKTLAEVDLPFWCLRLTDDPDSESFEKYDSGPESGENRFKIFGTQVKIQI